MNNDIPVKLLRRSHPVQFLLDCVEMKLKLQLSKKQRSSFKVYLFCCDLQSQLFLEDFHANSIIQILLGAIKVSFVPTLLSEGKKNGYERNSSVIAKMYREVSGFRNRA